MAHTYGISEVVGTSTTSIDEAITSAVARASTTVRGLDWFEVTEIRGHLEDGAVAHYQVGSSSASASRSERGRRHTAAYPCLAKRGPLRPASAIAKSRRALRPGSA